jgi:hypothetical protein
LNLYESLLRKASRLKIERLEINMLNLQPQESAKTQIQIILLKEILLCFVVRFFLEFGIWSLGFN